MPDDEGPGETTRLVVPVREVAHLVGGAGIVVLDPFLPREELDDEAGQALADYFGGLTPFPVVLGEAPEPGPGGVHVPVFPLGVFRRIRHDLHVAFPASRHQVVSLAASVPSILLPAGVPAGLRLPLEVQAREAVLLDAAGERLETFPFGTSAA